VSWHYPNPTQHVGREQTDLIIISLKINFFSPGSALTFSTLYSYSQKVYRRQSGKMGLNWKSEGEFKIIFILYGFS
jgi:hypothetical protein